MTDQTWNFIEKTLEKMMQQSDILDKATKPLLLCPESPLIECQSVTEDLLISALEMLAGDEFNNISWYVYECDYGREPREAGIEGDMRLIDSPEKLRWLITI